MKQEVSFVMLALLVIACVVSCVWRIHSIADSPSKSEKYLNYTAPGQGADRFYRFLIRKVGNEYRAYIVKSPGYCGRATDGHSTHRHYDGQYYVCWSVPVSNTRDMVNIAKTWADCTQKYIEYGTKF